jgi:hypothetical protein
MTKAVSFLSGGTGGVELGDSSSNAIAYEGVMESTSAIMRLGPGAGALTAGRASLILEDLGVANVARSVSMLLCRDWSAILNIDAPRAAALVRKPDRSE